MTTKMVYHSSLTVEKWQTLTLMEQLGNVGSEVSRAMHWRSRNEQAFEGAIARALELLDFTIQDPRWKNRLKELVRARELIADALYGGTEYGTTFEDLDRYFLQYALAARRDK